MNEKQKSEPRAEQDAGAKEEDVLSIAKYITARTSHVRREINPFNLRVIGSSLNFSKKFYSVKAELEFASESQSQIIDSLQMGE